MTKTRDVSDDVIKVWKAGSRAWTELKKHKSWGLWLVVGEALVSGRQHALALANTNKAAGRQYSRHFDFWLTETKLDSIAKQDRAPLLQIMDRRTDVEAWRDTLTETERLRLNHPRTVWARFKRETQLPEIEEPKEPKTARGSGNDEEAARELDDALGKLHAARAHIATLERAMREQNLQPPRRPAELIDAFEEGIDEGEAD